jgi:hypothetical protein
MIPDIFLSVVFWLVSGIIGWFPASQGFDPSVYQAAATIGGYTGILSPLVNFTVLASCVAIAFSVEIGVYGFRTLKWVMSHIPFIGGNG